MQGMSHLQINASVSFGGFGFTVHFVNDTILVPFFCSFRWTTRYHKLHVNEMSS